jgi:AcrR family transcriptional regulator
MTVSNTGPTAEVTPRRAGARLSAAERREQILDATKGLADARGFHEVTIDAVARASGVSRPIVYGHFGDLRGLLHALVDREGERAAAQLAALLPTNLAEGNPRTQLIGALRAFLEAVRSDPHTWRLVLMPAEGTPDILRERFTREREAVTGRLAAAVGPAFGLGPSGASPDPEITARVLQALSEELARLTLEEPDRYPVERLVEYADWALAAFVAGAS